MQDEASLTRATIERHDKAHEAFLRLSEYSETVKAGDVDSDWVSLHESVIDAAASMERAGKTILEARILKGKLDEQNSKRSALAARIARTSANSEEDVLAVLEGDPVE